MKMFCISGFLGLPQDWDVLKKSKIEISAHGAQEFIDDGISEINKIGLAEKANVLCGYSLGGRLALQAFLKDDSHWDRAIIVSAHPGLKTDEERTARLENDKKWSEKFLKTPWNELLAEWNKQKVFGGKASPLPLQREEKHFKRNELAALLNEFSLGRQQDLRRKLSQIKKSITFVAGADDQKFSQLAQEMAALNKNFEFISVPEVGHRVLWELSEDGLEKLMRRLS